MKKQFKLICNCKKEIIGFSENHVKKNLEIHKLLSREHKDRLKILKKHPEAIFVYEMNDSQLSDFLAKNPIMIEEIKEIGG